MASPASRATAQAERINQEQLLQELEQQHLALKQELKTIEEAKKQVEEQRQDALNRVAKLQSSSLAKETACHELQEQLVHAQSEKEALQVHCKAAQALAARRLSEIEALQQTVQEQAAQVVAAQKKEMEALQQCAVQEAEVEPLRLQVKRLKNEVASQQEALEWNERQLSEKTSALQSVRHALSKATHEQEEMKVRTTEEIASLKRQLENARIANRKLESSLIQAKEQVKETQAAQIHADERFQAELQAQQRLAELHRRANEDATERINQLQAICDTLRTKLAESDEALTHETERARQKVEHLFQEQAKTAEKQIEELQCSLKTAEERIEELEKKRTVSLQEAASLADLSSIACEAHLAAQGLSTKQLIDQLIELEEQLRQERGDREQAESVVARMLSEVNEQAPVVRGLKLDHERLIAAHTQVSERLDKCMQELTKSKERENEAWQAKQTYEKKCEALAQSVDDLSRQVQHLLFRSYEAGRMERAASALSSGNASSVSENLLVFKDVEELQVRNLELVRVVRELTEMVNQKRSDITGVNRSNVTHLIESEGLLSDEETGEDMGESNPLAMALKELEEMREARKQERDMVASIIQQRDMYRVLLLQSDAKFLEDDASDLDTSANVGSPKTLRHRQTSLRPRSSSSGSPHRSSFDVTDSRAIRDLQSDFEDYKKEKQATMKMLQETLDQVRSECTEAKVKAMQAEVDSKCYQERYDACSKRLESAQEESCRLRARVDQLTSLMLQHEQTLGDTQSKLESTSVQLQSLTVEKESASRELAYLKNLEDKLQAEMATLRVDNTNLLKLMEANRQMEATREARDTREKEMLQQKVVVLENKLDDAVKKAESVEALSASSTLELKHEKKKAEKELESIRSEHEKMKEQITRLEEQKSAAIDKSNLLEKDVNHLRAQLKKGAGAAAAERVAALEVQLRDAQRDLQASLTARKALAGNVDRYKALAEANEKSLQELTSASDEWKRAQQEQLKQVEKEKDELQDNLLKSRAELKEIILEGNALRSQLDQVEQEKLRAVAQAQESVKLKEADAEKASKEITMLRDEITRLKNDLNVAQENYERELQLHAAEVAKSASSRRAAEEENKRKHEMEAKLAEAETRLSCVEKRAKEDLERVQNELKEAVESKTALNEQNRLLHAQLERSAVEMKRLHEDEMVKTILGKRTSDEVVDAHAKEIDDLQAVITYLRRESEVASSKLDVAREEAQRYRAQIFALESTVERLRQEVKALTEGSLHNKTTSSVSGGNSPGGTDTPSAAAKRMAQLEQLSLLRESNATLREESQKNFLRYKDEAAKVKVLEEQIEPLKQKESTLLAESNMLKQELQTMTEANKRWKMRVDQLVEKYQQVDPVVHEQVTREKESLEKEVHELKTKQKSLEEELETLRTTEGKTLQETKNSLENMRKQYERLKGFTKSWKAKAELHGKTVEEKTKAFEDVNKALEEKSATLGQLENKLGIAENRVATLESEKSVLEARMSAMESSRGQGAQAVAEATAAFEKERQDFRDRLEAETKKAVYLKQFNDKLLTQMKSLTKDVNEMKERLQASSTNSNAPEVSQGSEGAKKDEPESMEVEPTPSVSTSVPTSVTASENQVTPTSTTPALPAPTSTTPQTMVAVAATSSVPIPDSNSGPVSAPVTSAPDITAPATAPTPAPTLMTRVSKPLMGTQSTSSVTTTTTMSASGSTAPAPAKAEAKETMSAEEKLRRFALQSMKKQGFKKDTSGASGAKMLTPQKAALAPASAEKKTAKSTEGAKAILSSTSSPLPPNALGSGNASGLVFGKANVTLPLPSTTQQAPTTSALIASTTTTATPAPRESEALRRSQRIARFGSGVSSHAGSPASTPPPITETAPASGALVANVSGVKRSNEAETNASPLKMQKKAEDDDGTTGPAESTAMSTSGTQEKEKQEESDEDKSKDVPT